MPFANEFHNYFLKSTGGTSGARLKCVAFSLAICAVLPTTAFADNGNQVPVGSASPPAGTGLTPPAAVGATSTVQVGSPTAPPGTHKIQTSIIVSEPKFPIGSKFSRTVQTVTGVNFFTQIIAGIVASRIVEKKVGGHVKVKVKVYSLTDLYAGKVKSVSIESRGSKLKDVPLGTVHVVTNDPVYFDWHKHDGKAAGLAYPFTMSVMGGLREQEVCKALATEALANSLRGLKLDLPGLGETQLQVLEPKVALGDNRIQIDAKLITKGASPDTGVDLTISAIPVLEGSKVFLRKMRVNSPDIIDPVHFAKFVEDLFNPIVDFGKYDRADHAFRLTSFVVERDQVKGTGNLLLVPRSPGRAASKPAPSATK
jgi:hypothetical protein